MEGQFKGFRFRFEGETLTISSAEPQIGTLKTYPMNGPGPKTEEEAAQIARGKIELDFEELSQLEGG